MLATVLHADSLCVGMELVVASHQTAYWRDLVAQVKTLYSGPLLYAANHGNENDVTWWDAVDIIGVDAYYPLDPSNPNPSKLWNGLYAQRPVVVAAVLITRWCFPLVGLSVALQHWQTL